MRIVALLMLLLTLSSSIVRAQSDETIPSIIIAYANEWAPISMGDGAAVKGILPDMMDEIIHNRMGIKVIHNGLPWARAQTSVEMGSVDAFVTTPTDTRLKYSIRSTEDVIYLPFQAFALKDGPFEKKLQMKVPLNELDGATFCDVLGNGWAKAFYEKRSIAYLEVPAIDNCLNMMIKGRVDVIIHAAPVTQLFINRLSLDDKIGILPEAYPESPSFPLLLSRKSSYSDNFIKRFDKVVSEMKENGDFDKILDQLTRKNIAAL